MFLYYRNGSYIIGTRFFKIGTCLKKEKMVYLEDGIACPRRGVSTQNNFKSSSRLLEAFATCGYTFKNAFTDVRLYVDWLEFKYFIIEAH